MEVEHNLTLQSITKELEKINLYFKNERFKIYKNPTKEERINLLIKNQ